MPLWLLLPGRWGFLPRPAPLRPLLPCVVPWGAPLVLGCWVSGGGLRSKTWRYFDGVPPGDPCGPVPLGLRHHLVGRQAGWVGTRPLSPRLSWPLYCYPRVRWRVERTDLVREGLWVTHALVGRVVLEESWVRPVAGVLVGLLFDHLGVDVAVQAEGSSRDPVHARIRPSE